MSATQQMGVFQLPAVIRDRFMHMRRNIAFDQELKLDPRYGYAFLLDKEGIIRWQGQGFSNPETLKNLFDLAEKLAQ